MRKPLLALLLFALVFSLPLFSTMGKEEGKFIGAGNGRTLYVGGDGPGNYSTIQEALSHAKDGDTIFVYSGYYKTKGYMISIFKSIRLLGEDRDTTIIDNDNTPLAIQADGVRIENFTIKNGGVYNDGLQVNYVENIFIHNCTVSNSYIGINVQGSSNVEISHCSLFSNNESISISYSSHIRVKNCISHSNKRGLKISNSVDSSVHNCDFKGEGVLITGDVEEINQFIVDMENNYVNGKPLLYYHGESNVVLDGTDAGEIIIVDCKNFEIKNMDISNTDVGIEIIKGERMTISNCSFHHNNYRGIEGGYIFNSHISNCGVYDNGQEGIQLSYARDNVINDCNVYLNGDTGVVLSDSYNTLISYCSIYGNTLHGISIVSLSSNEKNNISYCDIHDNEKGISIFYSSGNVIYNNNISSNNIGISLWGGSKYNIIRRCNIHSNHEGVEIGMYLIEIFLIHAPMAMEDVIYQNNFIDNDIHAYFFNVCHITWDSNYWDDWKGYGRKIIRGDILTLYVPILPLINFDKNPAEEPW